MRQTPNALTLLSTIPKQRARARALTSPIGFSIAGLRKAAARRLAEGGCSEYEIASITGHASLRKIARYMKAADRVRLEVSAMDEVESGTSTVKTGR